MRKITREIALEIRARYVAGGETYDTLAEKFHLHRNYIYRIINGEAYGLKALTRPEKRQGVRSHYYVLKEDGYYKKCKRCGLLKKVTKKLWYFDKKVSPGYPLGRIKYSYCKGCQIAKTTEYKRKTNPA